jgi:hypothetical protein
MFSERFRETVQIFYDLDEALLWLTNNNGAEHKVLSRYVAEISWFSVFVLSVISSCPSFIQTVSPPHKKMI